MTETAPKPNPLEEYAIGELLDELERRYDVAIFAGYKMTSNREAWKGIGGANTGETQRFYTGPIFAVLGLLRTRVIEVEMAIASDYDVDDDEE